MNQDIANAAKNPELLSAIQHILAGCQELFGQERIYRRVLALFMAEVVTLGRHTLTQLLRTLGQVAADWSAWYRLFSRGRVPEEQLSAHLLRETLDEIPENKPYVTTVDGVIVSRSGQHVAGSSWWRGQNTARFNRGLERGQRFVEIAWLTPEENSYCRSNPLRWLPAVTAKSVPSEAEPCKEWEAGVAALKWARQELDRQSRASQLLVGIGDGGYDVQDIWQQLPERTILIVRAARNRKLYEMAKPQKGKRGPGRPPTYGQRMPTPAQYLQRRKRSDWQRLTLTIRGRERHLQYQVHGPCLLEGVKNCPLFLIVVRGKNYTIGKRHKHKRYRKPYFMLVNAVWRDGVWQLPFSVKQLLTWAWHRWECEVAHRDMKSALGLGEKQCWGPCSALLSVQWNVWVYGVSTLAAYRVWGCRGGPRRTGRWYRHPRRWTFTNIRQSVRAELWGPQHFSPLYVPSLANWLKIERWATGLGNILADAGRI